MQFYRFLQTHEFNNYSSNVSFTLNNIISVNDNQNTSISSITNTIGSLLQTSSFNNTINNYLYVPNFNTYIQFVSSLLTNTFNLDITQNSRLDGIESTLPSYLQTTAFDSYTGSASSTCGTIIANTSSTNETLPSNLHTN